MQRKLFLETSMFINEEVSKRDKFRRKRIFLSLQCTLCSSTKPNPSLLISSFFQSVTSHRSLSLFAASHETLGSLLHMLRSTQKEVWDWSDVKFAGAYCSLTHPPRSFSSSKTHLRKTQLQG